MQRLTKKGVNFEWGPKQIESMRLVKEGVMNAQAIRPLDYQGQGNIVLAVDSSYISIGFYIFQKDAIDSKKLYYAIVWTKRGTSPK